MTQGEARLRYMDGGFVPTSLCVDAKSVFAASIATFIKTPAEKNLLCHVQYLRELLDSGVLLCLFLVVVQGSSTGGVVDGDNVTD